jgi:heptosyltransferase-2
MIDHFLRLFLFSKLWFPLVWTVTEPFLWLAGRRARSPRLLLEKSRNILVIRLDEIGDLVLTTPFLRELRNATPTAWITLVVKPSVLNLVDQCPYVNEVLPYSDDRGMDRFSVFERFRRAVSASRKHLWRRRYDVAIVPRWDIDLYDAIVLAYFSGARWRVGYSHGDYLDRFLSYRLRNGSLKHEVERNLEVLRSVGSHVGKNTLEVWLAHEDRVFADKVVGRIAAGSDSPIIAIAPGAGAPIRRWPLDRFTEVAGWLISRFNARVVVVGGNQDGHFNVQEYGPSIVDMVDKTTLRQTAAILERCVLFIGNDSGPMHLAAAAGAPIVEISCHPMTASTAHSNSPSRFGPWGVAHRVIQPLPLPGCSAGCRSDGPHCILEITVDQVKEAVRSLLPLNRGGEPSQECGDRG